MTDSPDIIDRDERIDQRDRRLHRTLAWVGIVTGVVFTVAVIFFSGFAIGRTSDGPRGWQRGPAAGQMAPGGCPMMGGMKGPGQMGPGEMSPGMRPGPPPPSGPPPQR
jgi:hypothetical protein